MSSYCENCEEVGERCEEGYAKALERIAELEKALRFHVATGHSVYCDAIDVSEPCNCGFELVRK